MKLLKTSLCIFVIPYIDNELLKDIKNCLYRKFIINLGNDLVVCFFMVYVNI